MVVAFAVIGTRVRERLDPYMMCVRVFCGFLFSIFLSTQSIINQRNNNIERNRRNGRNGRMEGMI